MKKRTIGKIFIGATLLLATLGAGFYFLLLPKLNQGKSAKVATDELFGWKFPTAKFPSTGVGDYLAYSSIRDPGGIPRGLPVRLRIPSIGVDTAIEDAVITSDGRMDVPAGTKNVAWFALGPNPGQVGSAVIGGHFGNYEGNRGAAVFTRLNQLKAGSLVSILDDKGDTITFVVRYSKSFDRNADSTSVFTSQDGLAHLNLITCEGVWNQVDGNYPQRLVVFTEAISKEAAAAINTPTPTKRPTPKATPQPIVEIPDEVIEVIEPIDPVVISPLPENDTTSTATTSENPALDLVITSSLLISVVFAVFKIVHR